MSLEELAQAVEQKGFSRQAVLLRSRAGGRYVGALLQPQWRSGVEEALGREIYTQLGQYHQKTAEMQLLEMIMFGELHPKTSHFRPREYGVPPLEIKVETLFDFSVLQKAAELTKQAAELQVQAHTLVYGEVHERTQGNDELLYEIYKDSDHVSGQLDEQRLHWLRREYHWKLSHRTQLLKRHIDELNSPPFLLFNPLRMLSDILPLFTYTENSTFQQEMEQLSDSLVERHAGNEEWESLTQRVKEVASPLLQEGERILQDRSAFEDNFQRWLVHEQETKQKRVLKEAREKLPFLTGDTLAEQGISKFDEFYPFSEETIRYAVQLDETNAEQVSEELLRGLYKSSLLQRERFLIEEYEPAAKKIFDLLTGLQQLLAGGPITNPDASPISVLQNHYHFPNIQYSPATIDSIKQIVPKLKPLLDELPDISDLATSTKMRKKKEHTYTIEELPKDPLDVTFGNDSGCCVFVPEELEKLQNGGAVVEWLLSPSIRLFGIYRQENGKKQRMGVVPAFETRNRKETKSGKQKLVLACNSVELSRFGISGGNQTIQKVVDHVENYLAGYAKEFGYRGCTMGRHSYNTSVNFSRRIGDIVDEELEFVQRGRPFYSDIFRWDEQARVMRTRPNSCYRLWKERR